jgi:glycosyltransferase involved in cell wall biosynthesis
MQKSERLRIGFCEGNMDGTIGGSYYSLLFLVESLDRSRFDPLVIFRDRNALWSRFEKVAEVHAVPIREPVQRMSAILRRGVNFVLFLITCAEQAIFLRRHRIQLLHLNNSITRNHDWMVAALIAGIPCITHERGINAKVSRMAKMLGSRLRAVICISTAVRDTVVRSGICGIPLHVIHNGLDPSKINPDCTIEQFRMIHGISPDRRIIGIIGNVRKWKGQEVVIHALPAIVARFPDVLCLFVGDVTPEDISYERYLQNIIEELGIRGHVLFTGYCPNVANALNAMKIAIHASIEPEPFGRVLLEAMAMKKPVVASRDGAVPEIVVEGVTGFTFTPGNSAELAERVLYLLEEENMIRSFGDAGYCHLMRNFDVMRNVERTIEIYESIMGQSTKSHKQRYTPEDS